MRYQAIERCYRSRRANLNKTSTRPYYRVEQLRQVAQNRKGSALSTLSRGRDDRLSINHGHCTSHVDGHFVSRCVRHKRCSRCHHANCVLLNNVTYYCRDCYGKKNVLLTSLNCSEIVLFTFEVPSRTNLSLWTERNKTNNVYTLFKCNV